MSFSEKDIFLMPKWKLILLLLLAGVFLMSIPRIYRDKLKGDRWIMVQDEGKPSFLFYDDGRIETGPNKNRIVRTATYVIAAADAPAHVKAQADYVCDGIADNVQIQAAIDTCPVPEVVWTDRVKGGSVVELTSGTFNLAAAITFNRPAIWLRGQGIGNTTLFVSTGADCNAITVGTTALACGMLNITVSDLRIDGNQDNNASGYGIDFTGCLQSYFRYVFIDHVKESGFRAASPTDQVYFDHCMSSCAGEFGWKVYDGGQIYLNQCYVLLSAAANFGYYFWATNAIYMDTCTYDGGSGGATGHGVSFWYCNYVDISDCDVYGIQDGKYGIEIAGNWKNIKIHDCDIRGQAGASTAILIEIAATGVDLSIYDNYIDSNFGFGVSISGDGSSSLDRAKVESNNIRATTPVYVNSATISPITDLVIEDNFGYVTDNSGLIIVPSGSTFAVASHNLAATPTHGNIMVTPLDTMGTASKFWVGSYTATQFTIGVNVNPAVDINFAWQACQYR